MKYTTDLSDHLVNDARHEAARRGITFEELCERALRKEISTPDPEPLRSVSIARNECKKDATD
jgi:hypothetical protein